jgi:hypothetical protein
MRRKSTRFSCKGLLRRPSLPDNPPADAAVSEQFPRPRPGRECGRRPFHFPVRFASLALLGRTRVVMSSNTFSCL